VIRVQNEKLLINQIISTVKPVLESWINGKDRFGSNSDWITLSDQATVYGIRRYLRGVSLNLHVDRLETHIISAILQIDQVRGHHDMTSHFEGNKGISDY
jgi:hypothetical protein